MLVGRVRHRHVFFVGIVAMLSLAAACEKKTAPDAGDAQAPMRGAVPAEQVSEAQAPTPSMPPQGERPKFAAVGVAEILVPGGPAPKNGWPVALLLHASRGNREDVRDFPPLLVDAGYAAISVSAPIADMGGDGYLWPPHGGVKMLHQYFVSALAPFQGTAELDLKRVAVVGVREGAWIAMLMLGVFPEFFNGAIALGPVPALDDLPNAPAPAGRPLAVIAASDDTRGTYVASHFEKLWSTSGVPFRRDVIPSGDNVRESWLLTLYEVLDWLQANADFNQGKFADAEFEFPEYPAQLGR